MMNKIKFYLLSAFLSGCAQLLSGCSQQSLVVDYMYKDDAPMWEHIFKAEPKVEFSSVPLGVILPHHLIVADELTKFYRGLAEVTRPKTIVVIGPNHYQNGEEHIQTCERCVFNSIDGQVTLEKEMITKLAEDKIAGTLNETFIKEHAIYNHIPFIKRFFPEAKVVPIVLKWETTLEETRILAEWLDRNLPADSLVIASVDFSHYIPAIAADFHDVSALATINNFDFENVYDLEVDSPPSLATIMKLMQQREYLGVERLNHTNNQDYRSTTIDSTTSHQFIAFLQGPNKPLKTATILAVGDIAAGKGDGLGLNDDFRWNIKAANPNLEVNPNLSEIRGVEDRFLVGADFIVFDLNDDSCLAKAQNGLKISFCKFGQTGNHAEQLATLKKQQENGAEVIYLLYQFAGSEFSDDVEKLATDFVDHGVDIFVGRGLTTEDEIDGKIERYKDAIIAYSLGDFIGADEEVDSLGKVLGIVVSSEGLQVSEFPIAVKSGKPSLIPNETPNEISNNQNELR